MGYPRVCFFHVPGAIARSLPCGTIIPTRCGVRRAGCLSGPPKKETQLVLVSSQSHPSTIRTVYIDITIHV